MLKNFRRSDIQTTPFVATKPWVLTSFHNDDVLLLNTASLAGDVSVALEFVDYEGGNNYPILNRQCNIALEQQEEDKVLYEEGEKIVGTFYPDSDPKNNTGTYKRLLYNQIKNAFYNDRNDPTKMFGMENIDFQLSDTKKFLSDNFRLFNVSKDFFGEKILENSVVLIDNALDDNFEIVDDGSGNIIARDNLFSKVQEVKEFYNLVTPSVTSSYCDAYNSNTELRQAGTPGTASYGTASVADWPPSNCQPW